MMPPSLPPLPNLPTVRFGYIRGPIRWENTSGADRFSGGSEWLRNERPIRMSFNWWAITHLQKKSRFGFLIMKPFIFHVWFTWRFQKQETKPDGAVVWVAGSERVTYGRTPGQRFDFADAKYISSRGYFSFTHWD